MNGILSTAIPASSLESEELKLNWPQLIDADVAAGIVRLMRETSASDPIIGFGTRISDAEATQYIAELRENICAGKWRLLTIHRNGELAAMCTMRRNLNPNNRHIADLQKGMIAHRDRGSSVLSTALHEIASQCDRDGIELVTLDVRAGTAAHRIWEHFGFEIYGTLRDYARVNGESRAGHFMAQKVRDLKARSASALQAKKLQHTSASERTTLMV